MSDGMSGLCVHVASGGRKHARALAQTFSETGEYVKGFRVEPVVIPKFKRHDARAGAVLVNNTRHAASVELGQHGHPGHGVLASTMAFLQAEWDPHGKGGG